MTEVHENKKQYRCDVCCDKFTEKHFLLLMFYQYMKGIKNGMTSKSNLRVNFAVLNFLFLLDDHISFVHKGSITKSQPMMKRGLCTTLEFLFVQT